MEKKPFHQWYLENKLTHGFEERGNFARVKTNSLFIEPPNEKKSYKHYQRGKNRGFDLDALWQEYEEYLKGEVIL